MLLWEPPTRFGPVLDRRSRDAFVPVIEVRMPRWAHRVTWRSLQAIASCDMPRRSRPPGATSARGVVVGGTFGRLTGFETGYCPHEIAIQTGSARNLRIGCSNALFRDAREVIGWPGPIGRGFELGLCSCLSARPRRSATRSQIATPAPNNRRSRCAQRPPWRSPRFPPARLVRHLPGCSEGTRPSARRAGVAQALTDPVARPVRSAVSRPAAVCEGLAFYVSKAAHGSRRWPLYRCR